MLGIFYFSRQCDSLSESAFRLPSPSLNVQCEICHPGSILAYNPINSKTECSLCPKNTYSPGNVYRLNGENLEFNNQSFNFTSNNCYLLSNNSSPTQPNDQCKGWSIEEEGSYIKTNNPLAKDYNGIYIASFLLSANVGKEGKLRIVYEKESIPFGETIQSGQFLIYINHSIAYEDTSLTPNEVKADIKLTQGFASILFEYQKHSLKTNLPYNTSRISMKISSIEIFDIDSSNNQCLQCHNGTSKEGSDRCSFCLKGQFLDEATNRCTQCPICTTTYSKLSIGSSSCRFIKECNVTSYVKEISPLCHIKTNKQLVAYTLIDNNCSESSSSSFNPKEIECYPCKIGQFKYTINDDYAKCMNCPKGAYSYEANSPYCSLCKGGIISNISYYNPEQSSVLEGFTINETIEDNYGGELTIDYTIINTTDLASSVISLSINSSQVTITKANQTIKLQKGSHEIKVNGNSNVKISIISITNTTNGTGYRCSTHNLTDCPPGTEYNRETTQCDKCPNEKYNAHSGEKCTPCPIFSLPSNQNRQCNINEVIFHSPSKLKFDLSSIKSNASSLCQLNQMECLSNNYYGPLTSNIDKLSYFFISMNDAMIFDSSISIPNNPSITKPSLFKSIPINHSSINTGFIYKTNNNSNFTLESITNIGGEINSITLLNADNDKGIIIKYSNGDKCTSSKRYQSFIFIKCQREEYQSNQMRLIGKDDNECSYYFEFSSQIGCPICNSYQITTKCNKQTVYNTIKANSYCIMSDMFDKNIYESSDDVVLLNETRDSALIKIYKINMQSSYKDASQNEIVLTKRDDIEGKCRDESEDNKSLSIIIVLGYGLLFLLLVVFIVIYCKYNQLNKDYKPLFEAHRNQSSDIPQFK